MEFDDRELRLLRPGQHSSVFIPQLNQEFPLHNARIRHVSGLKSISGYSDTASNIEDTMIMVDAETILITAYTEQGVINGQITNGKAVFEQVDPQAHKCGLDEAHDHHNHPHHLHPAH